jgi:hypothetical protein
LVERGREVVVMVVVEEGEEDAWGVGYSGLVAGGGRAALMEARARREQERQSREQQAAELGQKRGMT